MYLKKSQIFILYTIKGSQSTSLFNAFQWAIAGLSAGLCLAPSSPERNVVYIFFSVSRRVVASYPCNWCALSQ